MSIHEHLSSSHKPKVRTTRRFNDLKAARTKVVLKIGNHAIIRQTTPLYAINQRWPHFMRQFNLKWYLSVIEIVSSFSTPLFQRQSNAVNILDFLPPLTKRFNGLSLFRWTSFGLQPYYFLIVLRLFLQ